MAQSQTTTRLEHAMESLLRRLRNSVSQAEAAKADDNKAVVVTASVDIEVSPTMVRDYAGHSPTTGERMYWCIPAEGVRCLALGAAAIVTAHGTDRASVLQKELEAYSVWAENGSPETITWFGGMSFDTGSRQAPWSEWPDAKFVLPQLLIRAVGSAYVATGVIVAQPGRDLSEQWSSLEREMQEFAHAKFGVSRSEVVQSTKTVVSGADKASYESRVAETAADVRCGTYKKVVLARFELVQSIEQNIGKVLDRLETKYADNQIFALWHQDQCFVGASPERLVSVSGHRIDVDCLAGTLERGATEQEDARLEAELLASAKDIHEHEVVREWILDELNEAGVSNVSYPSRPLIKKLANVQHLHTPIHAERREGQTVLTFVSRLHPTPAVAGMPRDKAMEAIRRREGMDRGWYAGPLGWMNSNGEGQFAVALRCALVDGQAAYLFAGGGIMGDSNPAAEWRETEMKLRAVQSALVRDNGGQAE